MNTWIPERMHRTDDHGETWAREKDLLANETNRQQRGWHRLCSQGMKRVIWWVPLKNNNRSGRWIKSWQDDDYCAYRYCREIIMSPFWLRTMIMEIMVNRRWKTPGQLQKSKIDRYQSFISVAATVDNVVESRTAVVKFGVFVRVVVGDHDVLWFDMVRVRSFATTAWDCRPPWHHHSWLLSIPQETTGPI
jgi:hypothetical protein